MATRQAGNTIDYRLQIMFDRLIYYIFIGAIYLKNHINTYWSDGNDHHLSSDSDIMALVDAVNVNVPKSNSDLSKRVSLITDADKEYLRNVLIDAIIRTKDPLR